MAEIELPVLARHCLDRRIETREELERGGEDLERVDEDRPSEQNTPQITCGSRWTGICHRSSDFGSLRARATSNLRGEDLPSNNRRPRPVSTLISGTGRAPSASDPGAVGFVPPRLRSGSTRPRLPCLGSFRLAEGWDQLVCGTGFAADGFVSPTSSMRLSRGSRSGTRDRAGGPGQGGLGGISLGGFAGRGGAFPPGRARLAGVAA